MPTMHGVIARSTCNIFYQNAVAANTDIDSVLIGLELAIEE